MKCLIDGCGKECTGSNGLSIHIKLAHNMTPQEYYDKYLKKADAEGICQNPNCNNLTKFITLGSGYHKFCSKSCSMSSPETI